MQTGIYETLITHSIAKKLQSTECDTYYKDQKPVDKSQAVTILANHIIKVFHLALKVQQEQGSDIEQQITFCNDLIQYVDKKLSLDVADEMQIQESNILYALLNKLGKTDLQLKAEVQRKLPQTGLTTSTLFTGSNADISIDTEIEKDMLSADRIYLIVSFIRWSGLVIFEKILREISKRPGTEIRIITTTYMGATEARALEFLSKLPNTKIKISYNTSHERLHAKSYIFQRNTEYDTAYIGSSNMSKSALTKGLEWNLRVTSEENPHIIEKAKATFDHYWNSNEFEAFEEGGIERFKEALSVERSKGDGGAEESHYYIQIRPYYFQKEVLEKLQVERTEHGNYRNLVVSATGTGKTVISAFDFKQYMEKSNPNARLLFIAHRKEILMQARGTFRSVLGIEHNTFGQLWVDGSEPNRGDLDHLFISVQTFNSRQSFFEERMGYDHYDFIVIDEAHHATATTYRSLVENYRPKILLGLTATPERMDGNSLLPDFCDKIAAEIRLPDALKLKLLSPFQYFCISDQSVDLRDVPWVAGKYSQKELGDSLSVNKRVHTIAEAITYYLSDPHNSCTVCFCATTDHAEYMATELTKLGFIAQFLTGQTSKENRKEYQRQLKKKEINFLCVVDIFNEGIDIPEIDTVLFLRPTESLTVYLQQLGRGLRLADDKECLTVLDFVNQANENYNFAEKFRALVGKTTTKIDDEIEHNFPHLPSGCTIRMDEQSQEYILDNIRVQVFNAKRLRREISLFTHQVANKELTIHNFTTHHNLDLRVLYTQKNSWEILKEPRNTYEKEISTTELYILRALRRITHVDVMEYLNFMSDLIAADFESTQVPLSNVYLLTFYYDIWQKKVSDHGFKSIEEAIATLNTYPRFKQELQELLFALKERVDHIVSPCQFEPVENLKSCKTSGSRQARADMFFVHGHYSREQVKSLVGLNKPEKASSWREGVQDLVEQNAMLMMVTLNKSDKHFSATTSYEDYAISDTLFHWQSQNKTKPGTERGLKFINQKEDGRDMLLFVRDSNKDAFGLTDTYWFLGRVEYKAHRGSQPMSIEWVLENPIPPVLWLSAGKMAVG